MMPVAEMSQSRRSGLWLSVAYLWLMLITGAAIVFGIELHRLSERAQGSATDQEVQALTARAAELERQVAALTNRPAPITRPDFDAARQDMDRRLVQLEQALDARAERGDVEALHAQVEQLAGALKKTRTAPTPAPRPRTVTPPKPAVVAPPFSLVGIELRGNERLLSVSPAGTHNLALVRLLRVGDVISDWRLQAFDDRFAVFRVNGEERRLTVP